MPRKLLLIVGGILIAIGALDLLLGNTDKPVLPLFLTNKLTQQWDLVLIAAGAVTILLR
jgi:hypothetical protein